MYGPEGAHTDDLESDECRNVGCDRTVNIPVSDSHSQDTHLKRPRHPPHTHRTHISFIPNAITHFLYISHWVNSLWNRLEAPCPAIQIPIWTHIQDRMKLYQCKCCKTSLIFKKNSLTYRIIWMNWRLYKNRQSFKLDKITFSLNSFSW